MASALVELQNVNIGWSDKTVLQNVSLKVFEGDAVVIIGPSGEGKTSLLKTIAGLLPPLSGQVFIHGEPLYDQNGKENSDLLKSVGMLFQKNALFDSLTVSDNLRFPMKEVTDLADDEIESRIQHYLEAVGLLHSINLFPSELSGGMQKRLGIARAISLKPQLTLYDDPTAGLDPITSRKIVRLIIDLKKEGGATSIAVINDMNRVYQLANRILFLSGGDVLDCGGPEEILKNKDPRVQQFINGRLEGPLLGV